MRPHLNSSERQYHWVRTNGTMGTCRVGWPIRVRAAQAEHGMACLGVIDGEVDKIAQGGDICPAPVLSNA